MAFTFSTGLRDYLQQGGSFERAFVNGEFRIRSGSVPSSGDAAETGTLLCTVTNASGARTVEVQAAGSVQLTGGAAGSVNSIVVGDNAGVAGIEILAVAGLGTIAFDTSLIITAANIVDRINRFNPLEIWAVSDGAATPTITLYAPRGAGAVTWGVTSTATTITTVDVNFVGGTSPVNGLLFGLSSAGVIAKSGTWSGVNAATGTAGYWRLVGSIADGGGISTVLIRAQGTCGVSGADYNMGSTSLTTGLTHTVENFSITQPAS